MAEVPKTIINAIRLLYDNQGIRTPHVKFRQEYKGMNVNIIC